MRKTTSTVLAVCEHVYGSTISAGSRLFFNEKKSEERRCVSANRPGPPGTFMGFDRRLSLEILVARSAFKSRSLGHRCEPMRVPNNLSSLSSHVYAFATSNLLSCVRSTPGPGQYDPKRTAQGSANLTGEPSGAHTATRHGFSADRCLLNPNFLA